MHKHHSARFIAIVEDAKKRVREVTVEHVRARIGAADRASRPFHLVDVREESEYAAGHLPGAIHLGKGVIERDVESVVPDLGAEIICYCGGGYRSALACDNLQRMGYTNVRSMAGGYKEWCDSASPRKR